MKDEIFSLIKILKLIKNYKKLGKEKIYLNFDNLKGFYNVILEEKNIIIHIDNFITSDEKNYIKNIIMQKYNKEVIIKKTINEFVIPSPFIYDKKGISINKEKGSGKNTIIYQELISDKWLFVKSKIYSQYHDIFQYEIESFDPITKESKMELCSADTIGKWSNCISFLMNSLAVNTNEEFRRDLTKLFNKLISENDIPNKTTIPHMGWNEDNTEFFPYSDKLDIDFTGDSSKWLKNTINSFKYKGDIDKFIIKLKEMIKDNFDSEFIISEKFAAPLLDLLGIRSFSINYYGKSGNFKSLANKFGIACFGDPKKLSSSGGDTKLVLMEKLAKFHNLPFYIDEIKEETINIYGVGNESGRHRLNKNAQIMESVNWRTIMSCTSEHSMENDSNKEGEINRVMCLPVNCVPKKLEKFDDFSKEEFARESYLFIKNNYGLLGELYIQEIIRIKDSLNNIYQQILKKIFNPNKNKQHLYMISSICLGNYLLNKLFLDIDNIEHSIKMGKYFVTKLQDTKELDADTKMLHTMLEFYDINVKSFPNGSELGEFKNNYCYGVVRNDFIYFILGPLKEYLIKKGFSWNNKKNLIDKGLIEYKSARINNDMKKRIIINKNILNENMEQLNIDNTLFNDKFSSEGIENDLPIPEEHKNEE